MRFLRLDLQKFGPFTDVVLDLSHKPRALHVIVGSNAAGKSTSLRATIDLLFGIPNTTRDAHLHEMPDLRIGGRIAAEDGSELTLVRRKGNKNTLLDPAGNSLDESQVRTMLGGLGREQFEAMFGLSHQGLIEGGRSLLEDKGNVGESLFSAGLGGLGVHHLLKQLEGKAEAIFKPGGKNPPLNQAISAFKKAKKDASDLSLQTKDWEALQDELKAQRALSLAIETELQTLRASERRLRRIHGALAPVAHRSELQQQLAELVHVIELPEKAAEERRAAQTILADAAPSTARLEAELDDLRAKIVALTVPEELLSREAAMKQLRNDLGGHLKAASDLPRRRAELRVAEDDAKSLLQQLGSGLALDEIETLRVKTTVETRMSALGKQRGTLESALSAAQQAQTDLEEKLKIQRQKQGALAAPLNADRLRLAADLARKDGDLEKRTREQHAAGEAMQTALARGHRSLGLWHGPLEAIGELALPVAESIDRFEKSASDLVTELNKEVTRGGDRQAKIAQIEEQLEAQQRRAAVPTEAFLTAARGERERTWSLVRRAWLDGGAVDDAVTAGPALAAEHEGHTRSADEVADRLRREAESVTELASLLARKAAEERELAKIETRRARLEADHQADAERWRALWSPLAIEPLSPTEMRSWLLRYHKLADDSARRLDALRSLDGLTAQIAAHRQALREGLAISNRGAPASSGEDGGGETLAALVARAEEIVKHADGLARERSSLVESILTLEGDAAKIRGVVEQHSTALEEWKRHWAAVTAALGLDGNALPEEAEKVVEQRRELLSKAETRKTLLHRVATMEADARLLGAGQRAGANRRAGPFGSRRGPTRRGAAGALRRRRQAPGRALDLGGAAETRCR